MTFPDTPGSTQRRFIITFHDSTFVCIARELKTLLSEESYEKVFANIAKHASERTGIE